jgi:hypothetical protein
MQAVDTVAFWLRKYVFLLLWVDYLRKVKPPPGSDQLQFCLNLERSEGVIKNKETSALHDLWLQSCEADFGRFNML